MNDVRTSESLQLLHMDLFGPSKTTSISCKRYAFVIVNDYSRFTWLSSYLISMKPSQILNFSVKRFKEKHDTLLQAFTVIIKENLKINSSKLSVIIMASLRASRHLDLHSKMME